MHRFCFALQVNPLSLRRFWMAAFSVFAVFLFASGGRVFAQHPETAATTTGNWQFGFFAAGGFPPNYQINEGTATSSSGQSESLLAPEKLYFWNAGFLGGHMLSGYHGRGLLRRRGELMLEIIPFWLAHYPRQDLVAHASLNNTIVSSGYFGPINMYGASVTPLLYRWNFQRNPGSRTLPWAQVGSGLLWTNHKFPTTGDTSVINFTPQVGFGLNTRVRSHQTLDFGLKIIHISNAGLGDNDPGIDYSLQFSAGYSWWK